VSRKVGNRLPHRLLKTLDGSRINDLRKIAIPIITIDDERNPHPAMLSFSEVVAKDDRNVLLGVFAGSSTSGNLQTGRSACLIINVKNEFYYVKGVPHPIKRRIDDVPQVCIFDLKVSQVLQDSSPYAEITSPITFRDKGAGEPHEVVFEALRSTVLRN
jgi:hypothetical protein